MKPSMRRQRGIGLIGVLFYFVIGGFFLTIAMKLGPHYMEYLSIRSVMRDVAQDPSMAQAGTKDIRESIANRLYINDVRGLDPKSFTYNRTPRGYRIVLDYKVQEHLFSNVDAVLTFTHEVALTKQ